MKTGRAVVVVGVVLVGAVLVTVAMTASSAAPGGGGSPAAAGAETSRSRAAEALERSIDGLQARLRRLPGDWNAWAALGTAYVEQARVSGDPTYYPKAEAAFVRSLEIRKDGNDAALAGQAALAAGRHDFGLALRLADAAVAINPFGVVAHGIRVDALIELGRYPEAWQAAQTRVDLRPDAASLSRVAYAFELQGRTTEAREALQRVLADATSPADAAFAYYHLGELARNDGDLAGADDAYARGLAHDPSNIQLLAGRARVSAALGRTAEALADYQAVVARSPQPTVAIEYGELLESLGRQKQAQAQYSLVRSTATLFRAQGVEVDVELALFESDHGDPAAALAALELQAEPLPTAATAGTGATAGNGTAGASDAGTHADREASGQPRRAGIFVDDARAWALHRLGRDAEALPYARAAVALGTHRALFRYHLGVIEASLGQRETAAANLRAALAMDPHFSPLHVPQARALLATLEGDR